MNIVFDLDGTLIDSKSRLYRLFNHLVPDSPLSIEQYSEFKQNKLSNEMILSCRLGYNSEQIARFVANWMILIESQPYLALDTVFEGVHAFLSSLQQRSDLYVCTARQLRQPALDQLESLNLIHFFKQVLVTEQKQEKGPLIAAHVDNLSPQDWLVGDTGEDIMSGKFLNMKTCAVLSGFLSEKILKRYDPDLVLDSVINFKLPANV